MKQIIGVSKLKGSQHETGTQTNQKAKKQKKLDRGENTLGKESLRTISSAKEVPKMSRIYELEKAAADLNQGIMESEVTSPPSSNFIGKIYRSSPDQRNEKRKDSCVQRVYNFSRLSKPARHAEIIDVDEIEDNEFEVKNGEEFKCEGNTDSKPTVMEAKIRTKPRFKPHRNKRLKKDENESNTVTVKKSRSLAKNRGCLPDESYLMFRSSYRHTTSRLNNEGHLPNNVFPNYGSYNVFTQNDLDNIKKVRSNSHFSSYPENRFIFHPSNGKPQDHHSNNFLGMNIEDARKEQDRLLQKAATRVRNQPVFHVTTASCISRNAVRSITFSTLERNVHLQHPDHWKYRNFYSRLGLPRHTNESTIKSQYRRLARVYHPDRNIGKPDTRHKFEAVTEAYNFLMNA